MLLATHTPHLVKAATAFTAATVARGALSRAGPTRRSRGRASTRSVFAAGRACSSTPHSSGLCGGRVPRRSSTGSARQQPSCGDGAAASFPAPGTSARRATARRIGRRAKPARPCGAACGSPTRNATPNLSVRSGWGCARRTDGRLPGGPPSNTPCSAPCLMTSSRQGSAAPPARSGRVARHTASRRFTTGGPASRAAVKSDRFYAS